MMRITKISLIIILALIVLGIFVGMIILPGQALKYINKHGRQYTGREVELRDLKIHYWSETVDLIGFTLKEANNRDAFVSFDTLSVQADLWRLLSSELSIQRLHLVGPTVTITRKDSIYNFDDLVAFFNKKPDQTEKEQKKETKYKYLIQNIAVDNGKITFNDLSVNQTSVLSNVTFSIPYIRYDETQINETGIRFNLQNGGLVKAIASFDQKNGIYLADFDVSKVDISPLLPYMKQYFHINGLSGSVDGKIKVKGFISSLDSLLVSGQALVKDFEIQDVSDRKLIATTIGRIEMAESYPMKYDYRFKSVELDDPFLYFEMKDSMNNFLNIMVDTGQSTEPFNYYYQIDHFKISRGRLDFLDQTIGQPFNYHFSDIALSVDSLSSRSEWTKVYSTMRLNEKGKLKAELGFNPSDPYELKIKYVLTNFQLADLSVYSKYFVGFPIIVGNMYYEGKTTVTARKLTSENKLIIRNAQLGKKSKGLVNLPLKLALYLLKDINGDIIIDLPVSGDLKDPKIKFMPLVWKAFKNLIFKAVATPFVSLGRLIGVDPLEVKGLEFAYGDTVLNNTHERRIKNIIELEKKKPDMKLSFTYTNDRALESQVLAKGEAIKRYSRATGDVSLISDDKLLAYLREKLSTDTLSLQTAIAQYLGKTAIDSLEEKVSSARLKAIENALHAANDSTKAKIIPADLKAPENVGSRPNFEVTWSVDE